MKNELIKMLIESKRQAEYYWQKHENSFFGCYESKYLSLYEAEKTKVREIESQILQLS